MYCHVVTEEPASSIFNVEEVGFILKTEAAGSSSKLHGVTSQKAVILIFTALRVPHLISIMISWNVMLHAQVERY
jgi:hypothetical protein